MVAPSQDTCQPWATSADVTLIYGADAVTELETARPLLLAHMLQVSSTQLFHLAGRRYPGICRETVRPCGEGCTGWNGEPWWTSVRPLTSGDLLDAIRAGTYPSPRCKCGGLSSVMLPSQPVVNIVEVLVDGAAVPADEYRIDWNRDLVGLTGAAGTKRSWPCWQRHDLDDDQVGTFAVTYDYGSVIPAGGVSAAAALGYNLASASTGTTCELSDHATAISRQGVSISLLDVATMYPLGLTGVKLVDHWINSLRVGQARRGAAAVRLGAGPRARRTCC